MPNYLVRFPTLNSWNSANFPAVANVNFIVQACLAGFALWEMSGDLQ
jgi:hypothetical protein